MSKVIVVSGSRTWTDKEIIRQRLLEEKPTLVILGGHRYTENPNISADELARQVCEEEGIPYEIIRAKWERYGGNAGSIRNGEMLARNPDLLMAFWDGESPGTKGCIDGAASRGISIQVNL